MPVELITDKLRWFVLPHFSTDIPVKALYDYNATSRTYSVAAKLTKLAAEFDFQAGDIIAVTSTPEDGWWSGESPCLTALTTGELLDEARRVHGRTDFPSNL
jgi:hypothetical protein